MQKGRAISATPIGQITKLATLFVRRLGHCLACRQVSVPPNGRQTVNSDWDVVPHERNLELSNPEGNGGAIIFRVKRCSHSEAM